MRAILSHASTVLATYLACGFALVLICDPAAQWPHLFRLEVAATWLWRFYKIGQHAGW